MDAEPRTLDINQQQTILVNSARLHLSVRDEGNTNRAGRTRSSQDQQQEHNLAARASKDGDKGSESASSSSDDSSGHCDEPMTSYYKCGRQSTHRPTTK